jgi:hypothetical protein
VSDERRPRQPAAKRAAHPRPAAYRPGDLRRQGPRHGVPADPSPPPARRCTQHPARAPGRRRLRGVGHLRRPVCDAHGRPPGRGRASLPALPHHRPVLTEPGRAAHRAQPPLGRHGRRGGHRYLGTRLQLDPAQHRRAAGRDPAAQRLRHGAVRQVSRGSHLGTRPAGALRPMADRVGLRAFLRVRRGRNPPVRARAVRGHRPHRAAR